MALFNEILVGRFSNFLTRKLNMTGGTPAPTLAPEIMPVMPVQGVQPEDYLLRGDVLAWGRITQAAVALQYAGAVLTNPSNSGILVVVTQVLLYNTAPAGASLFQLSTDPGDVPTLGTAFPTRSRDLRTLPVPAGSALTAAQLNATTTTQIMLTGSLVIPTPAIATGQRVDLEVVLQPGRALAVQNATIGTGDLSASFQWRESPVSTAQQRDPR